jgi:hypothetical protein
MHTPQCTGSMLDVCALLSKVLMRWRRLEWCEEIFDISLHPNVKLWIKKL